VTLRDGDTVYEIEVTNPMTVCGGIARMSLDGAALAGNRLPRLGDGRTHQVRVELGEAPTASAPCNIASVNA
jgi:cellobiose phosphorylase